MKYRTLLFDADDTLFNFQQSAEKCFCEVCKELNFPDDKIDYSVYKTINQRLWDKLSLGLTDKRSVLYGRFNEYASYTGVKIDSEDFLNRYEDKLANTSILFPETTETIKKLYDAGYSLYIITNGVGTVQNTRLTLSGLRPYFKDIFISDEIGFSKPSSEYFELVKSAIPDFNSTTTLIIGDSLVSDIPLGVKHGVKTCRMNYFGEPAPQKIEYDYEINRLNEIFKILEGK